MDRALNPTQRRVLGVLMEKALTQPEYYPMTVNAIVAGCNQKSNRDPVMELDEVTVDATLDELRERKLVSQVLPAPGARSSRYKHEAEAVFGWAPRERAILTELLLRGPQTIGELRTRCVRMASFDSLEIVANVIDELSKGEQPFVAALSRESGRAVRYAHQFYLPEETPAAVTAASTVVLAAPASTDTSVSRDRLAELENRVQQMQEQIDDLRRRLDAVGV